MTIWVNRKTGATKNQYTQPLPASDWERKKEGYTSSPSDDGVDILSAAIGMGIMSSAFDTSPSYDPTPSFDGGGGDFGGGGGGGDW